MFKRGCWRKKALIGPFRPSFIKAVFSVFHREAAASTAAYATSISRPFREKTHDGGNSGGGQFFKVFAMCAMGFLGLREQ
jgi:hypothetical protein